MQNALKKVLPITAILTLAFGILVMAAHTSTVSIYPTESQLGNVVDFKIIVKNDGGDNINRFELTLPETYDEKPIYLVKEIARPVEWDFKDVYKIETSPYYPYKIIWTTSSSLAPGKSIEFNFKAIAPSSIGEYTWTWKTGDVKDSERSDQFITKTILAPFETFRVSVPKNVKAGEYSQLTVTALDANGNIKIDFTGSVSFLSSDSIAILPQDYVFTTYDQGSKDFTFKLKTAGDQSVTVKTGDKIITSDLISVKPGNAATIKVLLDKAQIVQGDTITVKVSASDVFGNLFDVTQFAKFSIDKEAAGKFTNNVYESSNPGKWTLVADYTATGGGSLSDGEIIEVVKGTVQKPAETPVETPVKTPSEIPVETPSETPVAEKKELTISSPESLSAEVGKSSVFNLNVKNSGNVDLTNVEVQLSGLPEGWASIVPTFVNIAAGQSQNYVLNISIPAGESGVKILTISTKSAEDVNASKTVSLTIVGAKENAKTWITGMFTTIISKPLYLTIAIVVLVVLILVIWKLIPDSGRKKSEE
jgi:hypothetical protein